MVRSTGHATTFCGAAAGAMSAGGGEERARRSLRRELARLGARRAAVAVDAVEPMQAEVRERPFTAAGWLFELKYDGYRLLAGRSAAGAVRLLYRSGRDATALFGELARAVGALPFGSLVLDGEAVATDAAGRPRFSLLQRRAQGGPRPGHGAPVTMFVFDLLACEGFDLRPLPLAARKAALRQVLAAADPHGPLRYVEAVEECGEDLFAAITGMGLEGVLAKRAASPYQAGRSADWVKVRADRVGDFAIVGYGPPAPADLRRLHLAVRAAEGWRYAGSVGSGLAAPVRAELRARLATARAVRPGGVIAATAATAASSSPASATTPSPELARLARAERQSVVIEPELVCEVRYKEWTEGGILRQPVFLRLRDDKRPQECEAPAGAAGPVEEDSAPGSGMAGALADQGASRASPPARHSSAAPPAAGSRADGARGGHRCLPQRGGRL
jgi:bifunctional non-homologous end joining protein LigD